MKKLLLFVLLASFSFGYGQNVSLSQLMSLRTMDLDDVEMFLMEKGWNYKDGEEETEDGLGYINFIYGTNGDFNYAKSFFTRFYSNYRGDRITLQTSSKDKYLEYLNAVKSFKPTLIYSGNEDAFFTKIYQGATTTFIFRTTTTDNNLGDTNSAWLLTIMENNDFDNN